MKAEPVSTEHSGFTKDLGNVTRSIHLDGILQATSVSANMCHCCGAIFVAGHDRDGLQFVALPISAEIARAVADNLLQLAAQSEALGRGRRHKH